MEKSQRCDRVRSEWYWSMGRITLRNGRIGSIAAKIGCTGERHCVVGCARRSAIRGFGPVPPATSESGRRRQMALALAHPQQGRFRIAADRGLHQVIQGFRKPRLCLGRRLAAAPVSANPRAEHDRTRTQVRQAAIDRAARNPRRPQYRNDPAMPGRTRLTGREQPPLSFVQNWLERLEASLDGGDVNHSVRISAPAVKSRQFPDSFVAFLSVPRFFSADSVVLAQALSGPAPLLALAAPRGHKISKSGAELRKSG
jgi:hypothetical protein